MPAFGFVGENAPEVNESRIALRDLTDVIGRKDCTVLPMMQGPEGGTGQ